MYSIQRDARNFSPLPDSFWPERWIQAASSANAVMGMKLIHEPAAFFPFSYGPANCAGKGLAMLEMRMVVSAIMQRLDLSLAEGFNAGVYESNMLEYFIMTRPLLPVVGKPRGGEVYKVTINRNTD